MKHTGLCIVAFSAFLWGCAEVGPNYQRPELAAPQKFSTEKADAPAPLLEEAAWWKKLGDPVLNSLVDEAVKSNLDLAQARIRIVSARLGAVKARAAGLPTVNAKGSAAGSDESDDILSVDTTSEAVYLAGFDVSWELDVFGGVRRQKEAAIANLDYYVEDYNAAMLTLLGDVAKNYIELRSNQELLAIVKESLETRARTVEITRERARLGLISHLDVAQAEAEKAATEAQMPSLADSINQSVHSIAVLLGKEPTAFKESLLREAPLPQTQGVMAVGLPAELLSRRPDLRRMERQLAAACAEIGVATAKLYPKFDLTLGLGLTASGVGDFFKSSSSYWSIVPGILMPLFDGGKAKAEVEIKKAAYEETLLKYREAYNQALKDVENSLSAYYSERKRNKILSESVVASERAVALVQERYRLGLTNFLDVLVAERTLLSARESRSRSDAKILTDLISLYKALGGGWKAAENMESTSDENTEKHAGTS